MRGRVFNSLLFCSAAVITGGAGSVAFSADAEAQGASEASGGDRIVVTARRREESLLDVPESISVFNAAAIEDAEIDEIADFGQLTPGVVIQQGFQGGDRPIVIFRGVGQIGGSAPSVILLSDGVFLPAGDPLRNQLFDIERIEVVKGPQGALYGRDTIGGVINVITKEPENEFSGAMRATYGSADEYSVAGAVNLPLVDDKLIARISGSYLESDGFFEDLGGDQQDTREEFFVRGRLLWNAAENASADLRVSFNSFNNGANSGMFVPDANTFISDVGGRLNATDLPDDFNDREVLDAALKVELDYDFGSITSITQYVDSDQTLRQDADFQFTEGVQIARTSDTLYEAFSQELRIASPGDQPFRWLAGAFYETNTTDFAFEDVEINLGLGSLGGTSNSTDGERIGLFAQVDLDLTDALTVSGAIRFDKDELTQEVFTPVPAENSIDVEEFSPKASISYKWSDNFTTYFTYGQGFRSGGFDAASSLPFGTETLTSMELGAKGVFLDGRVRGEAAVYRISYTDQQVASVIPDPNTGNLITTTDNLGESENYGFEVSVRGQIADGFETFASFDYLDTEIKVDPNPLVIGNQTPFRTEYTVSVGGQYVHTLTSDLSLLTRTEYYYQGPQTFDQLNTLVQEGYGFLSARVALQGDRWTIAASGENILDKEFNDQVFFLLPGQHFGHPGLPARWRVTASVKF